MKEKLNLDKSDIVIIGCGPVAVSFLHQLEERLSSDVLLRVVVFEKSSDYGKGYAYRGNNEELILNTPIEDMGVLPSRASDFSIWLKKNNPELLSSDEKFSPRYLFGNYLQEKLNQIMNRKNKLDIKLIQEEVIDCIFCETSHQVISSYHTIVTDTVVLIHGGAVIPAFPEWSRQTNYITDIYDKKVSSFKSFKEKSAILILGSNLSMIDACLLLKKSGKSFHITAASRSAYFPAIKPARLKHQEGEALVAEAHKLFDKSKNIQAKDLIAFLDQHFSRLLGKNYSIELNVASYNQMLCRRPLVDCDLDSNFLAHFYPYIDACIDKSWFLLSDDEKQKLSDVCRYLIRFICGFPESNFNKLKDYFDHHTFSIEKLASLSWGDELYCAQGHHSRIGNRGEKNRDKIAADRKEPMLKGCGMYQARFQSNLMQPRAYDYVIDCTGIKGYYSPNNSRLLTKNILKRGQIKIDSNGGISVDKYARAYKGNTNEVHEGVYALGEGSSGPHFIRGCFSFYAKQTASAIESLVSHCTQSHSGI